MRSMRIAAIAEYDGSNFSGWQRQENVRSVQACVEEALSKVANEPVRVTVAGRTDAGVHALAQVIHFDTSAARGEYSWVRGAISNLPDDVALLWAGEADGASMRAFPPPAGAITTSSSIARYGRRICAGA